MINHKAIRALYTNAFNIIEHTDGSIEVLDKNGNNVQINLNDVQSWVDPDDYKNNRKKEYPPMADQLDMIFHGGLDLWKQNIQAIKDKYPKPE
jgi:uncharacterized lipoprotein NlpE involved in copper resistance